MAMNIFGRLFSRPVSRTLRSWSRGSRTDGDAEAEKSGDGGLRLRRWDAASTNRLNKAHWSKATGATINVDLEA